MVTGSLPLEREIGQMRIAQPCVITSRLLPGIQIGDGSISIEYADLLHNAAIDGGRQRYRWYLDIPAGEFSGDDLKSGVGGGSLQSGLESLLSFLSAAGESWAYDIRQGGDGAGGENSDLFPPAVAEWAAQNSDELSMAAMEIEEGGEIIAE